MYFTEGQICELHEGLYKIEQKAFEIRDRFVLHPFHNDGAREHADHGFGRRIGDISRAIRRVYEIPPPDKIDIPKKEETIDATINIQSFVMNAFGCCENLAWIWVLEQNIRQGNGEPLPQSWIGLGPNHSKLRKSFSSQFLDYIKTRDDWFKHLKSFRDALAHRIPLYIPPFVVDPENCNRWAALGDEATVALLQVDLIEQENLTAEQKGLQHFLPVMTHSFRSETPVIVFHYQLLSDFNTVHEIADQFLNMMD